MYNNSHCTKKSCQNRRAVYFTHNWSPVPAPGRGPPRASPLGKELTAHRATPPPHRTPPRQSQPSGPRVPQGGFFAPLLFLTRLAARKRHRAAAAAPTAGTARLTAASGHYGALRVRSHGNPADAPRPAGRRQSGERATWGTALGAARTARRAGGRHDWRRRRHERDTGSARARPASLGRSPVTGALCSRKDEPPPRPGGPAHGPATIATNRDGAETHATLGRPLCARPPRPAVSY